MKNGRPLRFLTVTLGGWTVMRAALLWPTIGGVPALSGAVTPALAAEPWPGGVNPASTTGSSAAMPVHRIGDTMPPGPGLQATIAGTAYTISLPSLPAPTTETQRGTSPSQQPLPMIPPPLPPLPMPVRGTRWAGSAWLLARGGQNGTLTGGQLGGSQAGVRITYGLGDSRRLALAGRLATPLRGRGAEGAVGIEWRPTTAPFRLVAEQRFSFDGGRGGPTLMAIGGIGPTRLAADFRLEAYAQGGAIARDGIEGFADGAARVTHPIASLGRTSVDLGLGSWGAMQRGAGRLDVGPTMGVQLPVGPRSLRLTIDWRQRIAGDARPGSGPAVSLGTDF